MATQNAMLWLDRRLSVSFLQGGPVIFIMAMAIFVGFLYSNYEPKPDLSHFPILGSDLSSKQRQSSYAQDARAILAKGYQQVSQNITGLLSK